MFTFFNRQRHGFTLIELGAVILVMGALAVGAVHLLSGFKSDQNQKRYDEAYAMLATYPGDYAKVDPSAAESDLPKDHDQFAEYVRWATDGDTPTWYDYVTYQNSSIDGVCLEIHHVSPKTNHFTHMREGEEAQSGSC